MEAAVPRARLKPNQKNLGETQMSSDCRYLLSGDIGLIVRDELVAEATSDREIRQTATNRFFQELNGLSYQDQQAVWRQLSEFKLCSGVTQSEQQTHITPGGRKQTYAPR
jgi:hypothetical protein